MNLESAGDAPKVSMTHTVAVYEPSGGRVVHLHHVVVFGGAKNIRVEEAEGEAIDNAGRRGWNSKELRTLHVTELVPPSRGVLRVDMESGKLVSEKRH